MKLIAILAPLVLLPGEGDEGKTILEREFEARTVALRDAESALEATYLQMEGDFARVQASLDAVAAEIATAIRGEAQDFQAALIEGRGGRPPARTAQVLIATDWIDAALPATSLDPAFHPPLAELLAEPLLPSLTAPELPDLEDRGRQALGAVLGTGQPFAEIWNAVLYQRVADAREFRKAHAAYIEAGRRVERERSPERFDAAGDRLPPGMVEVKAGSYTIGPDEGWPRKSIGKRGKRVTLKPFYIDRTEVTNEEYHGFWRTLNPQRQLEHAPRFWVELEDGSRAIPAGREEHPVVGISFNDAFAYADWAGKRLPTEEEWEVAARGEDAYRFPWGNDYVPGLANDREAGLGDTAPVGSFPGGASPLGCLDMTGNVEEWTASTADGEPIERPLDSNLVQVVIRGGSFNSGAETAAATFRWLSPGLSTRKPNLGFRCAMDR